MDELVWLASVWTLFGTTMTLLYRRLWHGPLRWRHFFAWPVLHAYVLLGLLLPKWMAPAPRHVAFDQTVRAVMAVRQGRTDR